MQTATVKWIAREEFQATLPSGHTVPFDADRKHNTAPGPMEILLGALGACTSVDVVSTLKKKRKNPPFLQRQFRGYGPQDPPAFSQKIEFFSPPSAKPTKKPV